MATRIIALVSEPVSGEALRSVLGSEVGDAEVLVIAPTLTSKFSWLMDDTDAAIDRAEAVQDETVERLSEDEVDAAGDTGESDPVLAVQDALQTFPADQIVFFTHREAKRNWLEDGSVEQARERFDVPVAHMVVD